MTRMMGNPAYVLAAGAAGTVVAPTVRVTAVCASFLTARCTVPRSAALNFASVSAFFARKSAMACA